MYKTFQSAKLKGKGDWQDNDQDARIMSTKLVVRVCVEKSVFRTGSSCGH